MEWYSSAAAQQPSQHLIHVFVQASVSFVSPREWAQRVDCVPPCQTLAEAHLHIHIVQVHSTNHHEAVLHFVSALLLAGAYFDWWQVLGNKLCEEIKV